MTKKLVLLGHGVEREAESVSGNTLSSPFFSISEDWGPERRISPLVAQ